MKKLSLFALVILISMSQQVFAEGRGPCRDDIKKFCGNVPEGAGIRECIKQHESSLSESCKGMMKEMESRHGGQHGHGPCEEDVKKLCGNVNPEGGGIRECMKQHENDFSPACKDMMHNRMQGNEHRPER